MAFGWLKFQVNRFQMLSTGADGFAVSLKTQAHHPHRQTQKQAPRQGLIPLTPTSSPAERRKVHCRAQRAFILNSYRPWGTINVVFSTELGCSHICQKPEARSNEEKFCTVPVGRVDHQYVGKGMCLCSSLHLPR